MVELLVCILCGCLYSVTALTTYSTAVSRSSMHSLSSADIALSRRTGISKWEARRTSRLSSLPTLLELRGGLSPFTNDFLVSVALLGEVYIWLKFWTTLAVKNVLPSVITRKIIHTGSAPLFIMHWPLYSQTEYAPLIASVIPLLQIARYGVHFL